MLALPGAEQRRGLEVALEHLGNKIGGLPVEMVYGDSKTSPGATVPELSRSDPGVSTALLLEQGFNGLQFGLVLFLMAIGVSLAFGVMNVINLAHGSMLMLGAYFIAALLELAVLRALYRRGHHNQISGGEQQMAAIGRALMTQPAVLMLDEATEGLAPLIREEIGRTLAKLKAAGQSVLIVDRDLDALAQLADRFAVMEKGRSALSGPGAELAGRRADIERYINVA